ncbi:MAG: branched-chain amino acid transport system II carrier protein [Anaerococcus sp.]
MNKKLTKSELITVSLMLFGMFFGAGNLIFPPMLGKLAGEKVFVALVAFAVTAVIFPILGVVTVAKTEGLNNLARKVSKGFALVFPMLIYLSIGPGLGIPRAATLPFEMAFMPYLPEAVNVNLARFLYTCIFFGLAFWFALSPKKIVKRSGKFLTPSLLVLMVALFVGVLLKGNVNPLDPANEYATAAQTTGFLEGYNTMDTIAALNFGLVISLAIKTMNVESKEDVMSYTVKGGFIAGTLLFLVYAALSYIGYSTGGFFPETQNGAEVLTNVSYYAFGTFGRVLLASIFSLACLTTCIGLITSVSKFFYDTTGKLSYRKWVTVWSLTALVVANFGLNTILKISVPILSAIYPVSLMLIILSLTDRLFKGDKLVYKTTAYVTVLVSVLYVLFTTLEGNGANLGLLGQVLNKLPLYKEGLVWVLPSFVTMVLTSIYTLYFKEQVKLEVQTEV